MDLSILNPQQREAVLESLNDNTVLVAGAGSGKTRVVQVRTDYLINDLGVDPKNIMVVTFTNKAIEELRERLEDAGIDTKGMWLGTFHSICVRALRYFGKSMGVDTFTIMDTYDTKGALKTVMTSMNMGTDKSVVNKMLSKISWCKSNLMSPSKMLAKVQNEEERRFANLYQEYQNLTWRRRSFDFDDLLVYMVIMLTRCHDVRQWFWDNIKYIMIDESQDTNAVQFELIKLLAGGNNLMLVGDDWQSIYAFRNARPEYLLNFQNHYPSSKVLYLEQNYRSTQIIVRASNALIKNNSKQYDKNTFSKNPIGDPIIYHTASDARDEAEWIASEIIDLVAQGRDYKDIAILYRTNAQSQAIEECFMRRQIPYRIWGALGFYDRKEIKDVMGYLRVAANSNDEVAFKRILGLQPGVGKDTVDKVMEHIATNHNGNCLKGLDTYSFKTSKQVGAMMLIKDILSYAAGNVSPSELLDYVFQQTGYMAALKNEGTPDALSRVENLHELQGVIKDIEDNEPGVSIVELVNKMTLSTDKGKKVNPDSVNMMTIHLAKGLEFDTVFMAGVEENLLPHFSSTAKDSSLEEERRLMYVGMTRAKTQLYITNADQRRDYSQNVVANNPSRFIKEIPRTDICVI